MRAADNVAIPDFLSGAMENWGLITYRESLLYEEGVTTASTKDWIVEVVAHELAHMVSEEDGDGSDDDDDEGGSPFCTMRASPPRAGSWRSSLTSWPTW